MTHRRTIALAVAGAALLTTGCAGSGDAGVTTIQVAATTTPMSDIVEAAAEVAPEGYEIEMVEVSDYVQPNVLLEAGEIDANLVQFEGFMEDFNEANDASLELVQPVYHTVVAFYSRELTSLDDLPEGGSVVIPNDSSNAGRAIEMLAEAGLVAIADGVEPFAATVDDIADNPRDLQITQVDLGQLNAAYDEADAVFNLPSFARQIGLTPEADGLLVEQDPAFAVSLVARADNADSPEIAALVEAVTSDHVREVIESLDVPPAF